MDGSGKQLGQNWDYKGVDPDQVMKEFVRMVKCGAVRIDSNSQFELVEPEQPSEQTPTSDEPANGQAAKPIDRPPVQPSGQESLVSGQDTNHQRESTRTGQENSDNQSATADFQSSPLRSGEMQCDKGPTIPEEQNSMFGSPEPIKEPTVTVSFGPITIHSPEDIVYNPQARLALRKLNDDDRDTVAAFARIAELARPAADRGEPSAKMILEQADAGLERFITKLGIKVERAKAATPLAEIEESISDQDLFSDSAEQFCQEISDLTEEQIKALTAELMSVDVDSASEEAHRLLSDGNLIQQGAEVLNGAQTKEQREEALRNVFQRFFPASESPSEIPKTPEHPTLDLHQPKNVGADNPITQSESSQGTRAEELNTEPVNMAASRTRGLTIGPAVKIIEDQIRAGTFNREDWSIEIEETLESGKKVRVPMSQWNPRDILMSAGWDSLGMNRKPRKAEQKTTPKVKG